METLECRDVPTTITWSNGGGGDWGTASNWDLNRPPTNGDDVVIPDLVGNATITVSSGSYSVDSVNAQESLTLSGGELRVAGAVQVAGNFLLAGGTFGDGIVASGTIVHASSAGGTLDAVTIDGELDVTNFVNLVVTITNGLTLNGTAHVGGDSLNSSGYLDFVGSQTLGGTGSVVFGSDNWSSHNALRIANAGTTLTIGSGVTVRGHSGSIGFNPALGGPANVTLINQGTILADTAGGTIALNALDWSNTGLLLATVSTLNLCGTFASGDLGAVDRAGGRINLVGTMSNSGSALLLDASLNLLGGTIDGVTLTFSGGAKLFATSANGTLNGVTLNGDLDVTDFVNLVVTVTNGLTLNGTAFIGGNTLNSSGYLDFVGSQTLAGTGNIVFGSDNWSSHNGIRVANAGTTLTIGTGITVHGHTGSIGYVPSLGGPSNVAFANQGTIQANTAGGIISLNGSNWTNTGLINASIGTINLAGQFNGANLGPLASGTGRINIVGTLENTGNTVALNATTGSLYVLEVATIHGGIIAGSSGAGLIVPIAGYFSQGAILDGVRLDADLHLDVAGKLTIRNGLTLNGTATLQGAAGGNNTTALFFDGTQSLIGNGEVVLNDGDPYASAFTGLSGLSGTLTIDSGVTISGGVGRVGNPSLPIVIRGKVKADSPGHAIKVVGSSLTNDGVLEAGANAVIGIEASTWRNLGTLRATAGGSLNLGGTFAAADLGHVDATAGKLNLAGTLENVGSILNLNANTGSLLLQETGTIHGGQIVGTGGAGLVIPIVGFFSSGGTLDGVRLDANLNVEVGGKVTVRNGLTLNSTAALTGAAGGNNTTAILFDGTQILDGTGHVDLIDGEPYAAAFTGLRATSGTLTIGLDMTIRGGTGLVGNPALPLIVHGRISANTAGRTLHVAGSTVSCDGTLEVYGGAALRLEAPIQLVGPGRIVSQPQGVIQVESDLLGDTTGADSFALGGTLQLDSGSVAAPQVLEVLSRDVGLAPAGFSHNFTLGTLSLDSDAYVRLMDQSDNSAGASAEAIYTQALTVPLGAVLDLNGLNLYSRFVQIDGTVIGGTIQRVPDGGPLAFSAPTVGTISASGELDEWIFFGRAGETVTVYANPGSTGLFPTPAPRLDYVQLELLDADDNVLATENGTLSGQVVSLDNVVLPSDGDYRIRVRAATGQSAATGNYTICLWEVTPDEYPLALGQTVTGRIETPASVDRWTFSGLAGQTVQFDLLNVSAVGVGFDLNGPAGWTGFANLTGDSGFILLPADGSYVMSAHRVSGQFNQTYSFRLNNVTVTPLTLGTEYNGNIAGTGQSLLFSVDVPVGEPLLITLHDPAGADENRLFAKFGSPPTGANYFAERLLPIGGSPNPDDGASLDYQAMEPGPNQQILVPIAAPGTWYILVDTIAAPVAGQFSMLAESSSVLLKSVTPDHHGNAAPMELTLTGAGFGSASSVELVASDLTAYSAQSFSANSFSQISATFVAGSVPPGIYAVRVRQSGGNTAEIADAFRVTPGGAPELRTRLEIPGAVGRHIAATLYVDYSNAGDVAMPAPLLVLHGSDRALMTLDPLLWARGLWASGPPIGFSDTIQFLASGKTPGVLQPGESIRVPVYYSGLSLPWNFGDNDVEFSIGSLTTDNTSAIDWTPLQDVLRPQDISSESWAPVWSNFLNRVGSTGGDFASMLSTDAAYLGRVGSSVTDVGQLLAFAFRESDTGGPFPTLAGETDLNLDAPGVELSFARSYGADLVQRNVAGRLGYGWSDNWDYSLTQPGDGTIRIDGPNGSAHVFQPDSRGGYFAQPGDFAQLIPIGGSYVLRETDGTSMSFNINGTFNYREDRNGNRVTATYLAGRLSRLTHSSGPFIDFTYNVAGRIASVADSVGRATIFNYDASGQHLVSALHPDGQTTTYSYDVTANLTTRHALTDIVLPAGVQRTFHFDSAGRLDNTALTGGTDGLSISYNSPTELRITDGMNGTSRLFIDERGLLAKSIDPVGNTTFFAHDRSYNLTRVTDAMGQMSRLGYDSTGHLTQFADALGHETQFAYSTPFSLLSSFTDAANNTTRYTRDAGGNLIATVYADGTAERLEYDSNGEPTLFTNRRGDNISYVRDSVGRVLEKHSLDGTVTYSYDGHGNLSTATDASGITTLDYDIGDRLKKITYPTGRFLAFDYDAGGRRTRSTDQDGFIVTHGYDSAGRLASLTDGSGQPIVSYTYDAAGRLSLKQNGNSTSTTYDYDLAGRVLSLINHAPNGSVQSRFDYTYDALGRRTTMGTVDGTWTYSYDATGQLTHAVFDSTNALIPDQDLEYAYDAVGNRTVTIENGVTTTYTTNNLNQYVAVGSALLRYDADGNLVERIDGTEVSRYSYEAENRIVSMDTPDGLWEFDYDALGHRAATTHDGVRVDYLLDPVGLVDVAGEYDVNGLVANYTRGLGLTSRITPSETAYYAFDGTGNTSGLTSEAGSLSDWYVRDPFGKSVAQSGTLSGPYGFGGQYGLMQFGEFALTPARPISFGFGRFTSPDPSGLNGGINNYAFVVNQPTQFIDPDGLDYGTFTPTDGISQPFPVSTPLPPTRGGTSSFDIWDTGTEALLHFLSDMAGSPFSLDPKNPKEPPRPPKKYWIEEPKKGPERPEVKDPPPYKSPNNPFRDGKFPPFIYERYPELLDDGPGGTSKTVSSVDPNAKTGPAGVGAQGYVSPRSSLPYRIDFENESSATAPAQRVTISDSLSTNFDWSTFRLTEIAFGDVLIPLPEGSTQFDSTIPATVAGRSLQVQIQAGVDPSTGRVFATFQSLDPITGLPPDVVAGFLPPEDGSGRGLGHITFTIQPKSTLPSGTDLRNVAIIRFDDQPGIATNQTDPHNPAAGTDAAKEPHNTIDADPPTSRVNPLPPVSLKSTFPVWWSGLDPVGAGLDSFDVYVAEDGGPAQLWINDTRSLSAMFTGTPGHRYDFFSLGSDLVGNQQAWPAIPDATTLIADPPTARADAYAVLSGRPLTVRTGTGLLANDLNSKPRRTLKAVLIDNAQHGSVVLKDDGSFVYTPDGSYAGRDFFTYKVHDNTGRDSNIARVDLADYLVTFHRSQVKAPEGKSTTLTIDLSSSSAAPMSVAFQVAPQSARDRGEDFTLLDGTINFVAGQKSATVTVSLKDDQIDESNENFEIWLLDGGGSIALGRDSVATVTIVDTDSPPLVSFREKTSSGPEGTTANVEIYLSAASGRPVTVHYAAKAGKPTAANGVDFTLTPSTVTFAPGETSKIVSFPITDDLLDENDEVISLRLSRAANARIKGFATHVITILDNDPPPQVAFDAGSSSMPEDAGTVWLTVSLSAPSSLPVSVKFTWDGGTATLGKDVSIQSGTLKFKPGETSKRIAVYVVDDREQESSETVQVRLASSVNALLGLLDVHSLTIIDDD